MNARVRLFLSCAAMLAAACSTAKIRNDYVESTNFHAMKTYAWAPPRPGRVDGVRTPLEYQIESVVDQELAAKGFVRTKAEPDFLVASHVGAQQKIDVRPASYGPGPYRFHRRGVDVHQVQEGMLIVDVIDPHTRQIVWRGVLTKNLDSYASRRERAKALDEAIAQVLADFPPKEI